MPQPFVDALTIHRLSAARRDQHHALSLLFGTGLELLLQCSKLGEG
jgi:hypothetical protein